MDCESDEINSGERERKKEGRQTPWRQYTSEQQHEKTLPSVTHGASTQLEQKPAQGILGMGATKSSALATCQTAFKDLNHLVGPSNLRYMTLNRPAEILRSAPSRYRPSLCLKIHLTRLRIQTNALTLPSPRLCQPVRHSPLPTQQSHPAESAKPASLANP